MVDRYRVWVGAGVLAGGVSAAMLAGAGVAAADDGTSSSGSQAASGSDDSSASESAQPTKSGADKHIRTPHKPASADTGSDSGGGRHRRDDADEPDKQPTSNEVRESPSKDTEESGTAAPKNDASKDEVGKDEVIGPAATAPAVDGSADEKGPAQDPGSPTPSDTETAPAESQTMDADDVPTTFVSSIENEVFSSQDDVVMRVAAANAPSMSATPLDLLEVLNDIGTYVYNLYTSTMQFLAGPVRPPFGSRVRVESSTLALGNGVVVPADWYIPQNRKPPTGLIYLQHGFLATASFYSATAAYLAERTNSIVVAPTLTWNPFDIANYPLTLPATHRAIANLFVGDRAALNDSAHAAGYNGVLPTRVVLVGHSAGGGAVAGAAGYMADLGIADNLAGVVMLDGAAFFDQMKSALAKIPLSIPVYNLAAEPESWNIYGDASRRLAQARPGTFTGVLIAGGLHTDSMRSTSPMIDLAASLAVGFSSPWNVAVNQLYAAGWISDMLNGTHTARLYKPEWSSLNLITGWWTDAVAQVLPVQNVRLTWADEMSACLADPVKLNCDYLSSIDGGAPGVAV